ncbi:hypothetical protein JYA63_10575 [Fictibacillus nanhaiensis]|uniref:Uncharacterized protein n=1 Tax=Fictibacillus nanhaiensis TaxID=742169 RepID=A0ABS2ZTP4_9BACL|nr:hypothetical protein [Fictibacillus nanhaiensis]
MLLLLIILVGCTEDEKLVRVDYQLAEMSVDDDGIVTDEDQIHSLGALLEKMQWESGKMQASRKEDMMLTFFYLYDPNMPERLEEYKIWFHNDRSAEIADLNEHRYGKLSGEDVKQLKKLIK